MKKVLFNIAAFVIAIATCFVAAKADGGSITVNYNNGGTIQVLSTVSTEGNVIYVSDDTEVVIKVTPNEGYVIRGVWLNDYSMGISGKEAQNVSVKPNGLNVFLRIAFQKEDLPPANENTNKQNEPEQKSEPEPKPESDAKPTQQNKAPAENKETEKSNQNNSPNTKDTNIEKQPSVNDKTEVKPKPQNNKSTQATDPQKTETKENPATPEKTTNDKEAVPIKEEPIDKDVSEHNEDAQTVGTSQQINNLPTKSSAQPTKAQVSDISNEDLIGGGVGDVQSFIADETMNGMVIFAVIVGAALIAILIIKKLLLRN